VQGYRDGPGTDTARPRSNRRCAILSPGARPLLQPADDPCCNVTTPRCGAAGTADEGPRARPSPNKKHTTRKIIEEYRKYGSNMIGDTLPTYLVLATLAGADLHYFSRKT
jgi:hypothetical protein